MYTIFSLYKFFYVLAFTHQLCQAVKKSKIDIIGCFIVSFIPVAFFKAEKVLNQRAIMTVVNNEKRLWGFQSLSYMLNL
jgi:hypothetical protein